MTPIRILHDAMVLAINRLDRPGRLKIFCWPSFRIALCAAGLRADTYMGASIVLCENLSVPVRVDCEGE